MRYYLSVGIFFSGIILAVYVGGWILLIKPVMACALAFRTGLLTTAMAAVTVIKCAVSWVAAGVIFGLAYIAARIVGNK